MQQFNRQVYVIAILAAVLGVGSQCTFKKKADPINPTGIVTISFKNVVGNAALQLDGPSYTNPFGESYVVKKFKYYISNIQFGTGTGFFNEPESYHLVDQASLASLNFTINVPTNRYTTVSFMLGVDSLRNVSGAQSGALDPLKDMFWTWNSGYIMMKLEGASPASNQVNNKIEYHIGGFSGANSVLKRITLTIPNNTLLDVKEGRQSQIQIEADLDKWWQNPNDIRIAAQPVCIVPGVQAKQIADNYAKMFILKSVVNN